VSAETLRHWLHDLGWAWNRAKVAAKDEDPQGVEKFARIRLTFEQMRAGTALFFAAEVDSNLLPKVGYQWMLQGEQVEVRTPGTNEKRYQIENWDRMVPIVTPYLLSCPSRAHGAEWRAPEHRS
jgi:hypothetical protein